MRPITASIPAFLFVIFLTGPSARAEDASLMPAESMAIPAASVSVEQASHQALNASHQALKASHQALKAWTRSLAPLIASQTLDAASSYGYRELNPMLANSNGNFGMKSTVVKFAVVGALIGAEYLVVRRSPRAGRLLAILNWSGAAVTTGLAVHNYAVR